MAPAPSPVFYASRSVAKYPPPPPLTQYGSPALSWRGGTSHLSPTLKATPVKSHGEFSSVPGYDSGGVPTGWAGKVMLRLSVGAATDGSDFPSKRYRQSACGEAEWDDRVAGYVWGRHEDDWAVRDFGSAF